MSTSRLGRYDLLGPLGRGGMAEVWRARVRGAASFSREVALKVMLPECATDPDFVSMFVHEAVVSARLDHPNIVSTLDFGRIGDRYYIVLELIDGVSLRSAVRARSGQAFSRSEAVFIVSEVAAALDYAYSATDSNGQALKLVHRDVNPSNVMLTSHGEVKLNDFGIAKTVSSLALTLAGDLKGKLNYMSPEQAWGRPLDGRSDVYALGLTLFELLTGKSALRGHDQMEIIEAARSGQVIPPGMEIEGPLAPILARALAVDPAQRYPTAGELRDALRESMGDASIPAIRARLSERVEEALARERAAAERSPPLMSIDPSSMESIHDRDEGSPEHHTEVATTSDSALKPRPPEPEIKAKTRSLPLVVAGTCVFVLAGWFGYSGRSQLAHPTRAPSPPTPTPSATTASHTPPAPTAPPRVEPADELAPGQPVARPPRPPSQSEPAADHRVGGGTRNATVRVQIDPWAEVWVDGRSVGMSPLRPLDLPAGLHEIVAKNPALGTRRIPVRLAAGQSKLVVVKFDERSPNR